MGNKFLKGTIKIVVLYIITTSLIRFFFSGNLIPAPNQFFMEISLRRNEDIFNNIINYIINIDLDSLHISSSIDISNNIISDVSIINNVNTIFRRGYEIIYRRNYILKFQRWSTLDMGVGIAYSLNGVSPTNKDIDFLVTLKQLNLDNWYFYVSNFTVYRSKIRNTDKLFWGRWQ